MVFNDTRVIPARLIGRRKDTGGRVEILLAQEEGQGTWQALVRGLSRLKVGVILEFGGGDLEAELVSISEGRGTFRLSCNGDLPDILQRVGKPPLPPYIRRDPGKKVSRMDYERYQTVYARRAGAIAAPTAGLHFTPELLENIRGNYAQVVSLTLHVGVGTFQPIREEDPKKHSMLKEHYRVPRDTWNRIVTARREGRNILAVGTTSTRVLESLNFDSPADADVSDWTERFIYPGQAFQTVNQLLTNFHLPRSSLFLLVNAFAGRDLIGKAYSEAVRRKYRFYSYGDAMLIL